MIKTTCFGCMLGLNLFLMLSFEAFAQKLPTINIAYISQEQKIPAALSNLDAFIPHQGLLGAQLALADNNTTGKFTGQEYKLQQINIPLDANVNEFVTKHLPATTQFIVSLLPTSTFQALQTNPVVANKLIFDAATSDNKFRQQQCQPNTLHILPSRAMRADALAQFMLKKRWKKWFLVVGATPEDKLFAQALKRAAKRFGMQIVAEKSWKHTYDARRTAQKDVPVFTQNVDAYDVLVVADEQGLFGEYLSYRTWKPRPVIGTQGLIATAWHRTHEQWGAVQIQNRFHEQAGRWMTELDYGAYLAVRSIGEASVRAKSHEMLPIKTYLLGNKFALQGYKGKPLSFRTWNGQLRQPILLAAARSLITVAPIEGFLHPNSELDTLGFDEPESTCGKK